MHIYLAQSGRIIGFFPNRGGLEREVGNKRKLGSGGWVVWELCWSTQEGGHKTMAKKRVGKWKASTDRSGGDLPGGIKLDEKYFGGERILHVGSIRSVRASGLRRMLGFAVCYMCGFRTRLGYIKRISQSILVGNGWYSTIIFPFFRRIVGHFFSWSLAIFMMPWCFATEIKH